MKQFYRLLFFTSTVLFQLSNSCVHATESEIFTVNKKNVVHKFVSSDPKTDYFVKNIFENWECETFDVFDQVKDKDSIAIDIGAWIGTTSIWLSKNFQHVVAVEADYESIKCLQNNLNQSECSNITIAPKPVMDVTKKVVFGPRGNTLNESISYIKEKSDNPLDYCTYSITFKQLIHDYVYENEALKNTKISFIKCDIEGGEENILEDVLHFAYNNNCKVYMSFHVNWWQDKKIEEFAYLFKYFKTGCLGEDVLEYVKNNPFGSLLFEPIDAGVLIKKNIPVVIIGYNQYTFIKNMVEQLEKYTKDIIIVDNKSDFQPLLDYYKNDFKYTVLRKNTNFGSNVYTQKSVQDLVGNLYVITDPDLKFNSKLPDNFLQDFIEVSNHFEAERVGFALSIEAEDLRTDAFIYGQSIKEWESRFWKTKLPYLKNQLMTLYDAPIDTTFCLINRKFNTGNIRVAGDYTCIHIPWHLDFQKQLVLGEYESYLKSNISTNWYFKHEG
jgi:FkbM family methyltransferase